ncbi:MAG: hypothetical protein IME98_02595 [Proteobacteria bacterium]|nr:hypothetical protein [Pseudomonadota bacterium]
MSKTKVIALSILITLLIVPFAHAMTASLTMAMGIVKSFDTETKALLPEDIDKKKRSAFLKINKKKKKEAYSRLSSLRHSEGPSPKRFKRIYKTADKHTKGVIKEVDKLAKSLNDQNRVKVEDMSAGLRAIREELLKELKETTYSEIEPTNRNKPEPVIDRSPYEERPGDTRGIYNR